MKHLSLCGEASSGRGRTQTQFSGGQRHGLLTLAHEKFAVLRKNVQHGRTHRSSDRVVNHSGDVSRVGSIGLTATMRPRPVSMRVPSRIAQDPIYETRSASIGTKTGLAKLNLIYAGAPNTTYNSNLSRLSFLFPPKFQPTQSQSSPQAS